MSKRAPSEREWVKSFVPELEARIRKMRPGGAPLRVVAGRRLTYASEVHSYEPPRVGIQIPSAYETDVLIYDEHKNGSWVPRVVIECKRRSVTTHDALTYSTKAATHKNVHPYLRYGFLTGNRGSHSLPARLVRHGTNFDFMASWVGYEATTDEWNQLVRVIKDEVRASRRLQELLTNNRSRSREHYSIIHRRLTFR